MQAAPAWEAVLAPGLRHAPGEVASTAVMFLWMPFLSWGVYFATPKCFDPGRKGAGVFTLAPHG